MRIDTTTGQEESEDMSMDGVEMIEIAKPIIFNTEMVRAILNGRKTMTRRVCKDANDYTVPDMSYYNAEKRTYAIHSYADKEHTDKLSIAETTCPICPGDILYVSESFAWVAKHIFWYKATPPKGCENILWESPIHMPKEAARIWLKVTNVRVERLQNITEEDAWKEGIISECAACTFRNSEECKDCANCHETYCSFVTLWDSTIKKQDVDLYGWIANPYVFVIEFEQCENPAIKKMTGFQ